MGVHTTIHSSERKVKFQRETTPHRQQYTHPKNNQSPRVESRRRHTHCCTRFFFSAPSDRFSERLHSSGVIGTRSHDEELFSWCTSIDQAGFDRPQRANPLLLLLLSRPAERKALLPLTRLSSPLSRLPILTLTPAHCGSAWSNQGGTAVGIGPKATHKTPPYFKRKRPAQTLPVVLDTVCFHTFFLVRKENCAACLACSRGATTPHSSSCRPQSPRSTKVVVSKNAAPLTHTQPTLSLFLQKKTNIIDV